MNIEGMSREQLEAIVRRLPVTADGVPVVPGMEVARWGRGDAANTLIVAFADMTGPIGVSMSEPGPEFFTESGTYKGGFPFAEWSDCYSSPQAAEDARGGE